MILLRWVDPVRNFKERKKIGKKVEISNGVDRATLLVFFKVPHPSRPVTRLGPACHSPEAVSVVLPMPLECPQLLNSYLSNRPIQKQVIYKPVVPVDAEMLHFMGSAHPLTIIFRRSDPVGLRVVVLIEGPPSPPHSIGKNGYIVPAFNISCLPIPFNRTALNLCLSRP